MNWLRTTIFLSVLLLFLGGSCAYLAERSMALWPPLAGHAGLIRGLAGAALVLMLAVPILHRIPALAHRIDPLLWLSYGVFGLVSTALLYLAVADLAQGLLAWLTGFHAGAWALALAAGATLASLALGLATALRPVATRTVAVPIDDLPEALDGLRIVQISDLHLGPLVRNGQVEHIVAASNRLQPDLIAVTGDLVDGEADGVRSKAERMGALRARHGVFFVTGNHEYYSGVDRWLELIRAMGWEVLDNRHVLLDHRGAALAIAGMPDPTAAARPGQGPDLARALAGIPADATRILLFHPPSGAAAAERAGVRLQLSGHTHGGQYFPWTLVVPLFHAYPKGLARCGRMWIYTSVGTGFWGPPNRFLLPPELTLLVLKQA